LAYVNALTYLHFASSGGSAVHGGELHAGSRRQSLAPVVRRSAGVVVLRCQMELWSLVF